MSGVSEDRAAFFFFGGGGGGVRTKGIIVHCWARGLPGYPIYSEILILSFWAWGTRNCKISVCMESLAMSDTSHITTGMASFHWLMWVFSKIRLPLIFPQSSI